MSQAGDRCIGKGVASDTGFTLIPVLWTVTLLALIVTLFLSASRTQTLLAANALDAAHAGAGAESGISLGVLDLLAAAAGGPRRFPLREPVSCRLAGDDIVTVVVESETGKVDLNIADTALLQRVIGGLGYSRAEASRFADAILDYRDPDSLRRLNGAEADDYLRAGLKHGPANGPFIATEELGSVLGLPASLTDRLQPLVTVHSGRAEVDLAEAPRALLAALNVEPSGTRTGPVSASHVFTIRSFGRSASGAVVGIEAIVGLTQGAGHGFSVSRWRRGIEAGRELPVRPAALPAC